MLKKTISTLLIIITLCSCVVGAGAKSYKVSSFPNYPNFYENNKNANETKNFDDVFKVYDDAFIKQEVERVVSELNLANANEKTKTFKIVEWIFSHMQYGYKVVGDCGLYTSQEDVHIFRRWQLASYSILGAFTTERIVCSGYAQTFFLLAARSGLEVIKVGGSLYKGSSHAWNMVKIDGLWYMIDLVDECTNSFCVSLKQVSNYRFGSQEHYNPKTNELCYTDNLDEFIYPQADGLRLPHEPNAPDIKPSVIQATPACGSSVKIKFSRVEGAICYKIIRQPYYSKFTYEAGRDPYGGYSSLVTISPEKAEQLNYTYYDNTYRYDNGETWEPVKHLSDDTSERLWEGKKYAYVVVAIGAKEKFEKFYYSNWAIVTTNANKGDLQFFKYDGKLEPHHFGPVVGIVQEEGCRRTGVFRITCKDCGYTYFGDNPISGHQYSKTVLSEPNCTQEGRTRYVCSFCGEDKIVTVPANGHNYVTTCVLKNQGCEEDGQRICRCTVCGDSITKTEPKTGHKWINQGELYPPTCTDDGAELWYCKLCHKNEQRPIPALKHKFAYEKIPASSYTVGLLKNTCLNCHIVFYDHGQSPTGFVTGFEVSAKTAYSQCFTWNKISTATGYQIQCSTADGKQWDADRVYTIGNINRFKVKNLSPMSPYKYRIRFYIRGNDYRCYYSSWQVISSPTLPKGTKLKSINERRKAVKVAWYKQDGVSGYQLQLSPIAKKNGAKTVTVYGAGATTRLVTALIKNAKYSIRIRTFKKIGNHNYFSSWSDSIFFKTK